MGPQDVLAAAFGTAAGQKLERSAAIRLRMVDATSAAGCRIAGHGGQYGAHAAACALFRGLGPYSSSAPSTLPVVLFTRCTCRHARHVTDS